MKVENEVLTYFTEPSLQTLRTGNWADYHLFYTTYGWVTCGWMEFHTDDKTDDGEDYCVEVLWVNPYDEPCLMYSEDGQTFTSKCLKNGDRVRFNQTLYHALLPIEMVSAIPYTEDENHPLFVQAAGLARVKTSPKIIFKFI